MSNIILPSGGDDGYQIQRSLRLRSSATAYLNRTPASSGNLQRWTWSAWVKRGALGASISPIFVQTGSRGTANFTSYTMLFFDGSDQLSLNQNGADGTSVGGVKTNMVFRDPSAWYHIACVWDTANATATSRLLIYVNGVLAATTTLATAAQNLNSYWNQAALNELGLYAANVNYPFDGYLSEINFIDGQALTPASFGQIDPVTGVWAAKKYAGTYGTNGFYLPFTDNSAATAAAIGADKSGNGNNWTPNNISVTAGATYDSMTDVPLGAGGSLGNGQGNYAVINPITAANTNVTVTNGNLQVQVGTTSQNRTAVNTLAVSSGKWYVEGTVVTGTSADLMIGIIGTNTVFTGNTYAGQFSNGYTYAGNALRYNNASGVSYGATYTAGDVIGVALDLDGGTLTYYKNGVSQGQAYSGISGEFYFAFVGGSSAPTWAANFGQRPFTYTPPTGFKALHTGNLPDPVIKLPANYMAATTYTGNGVNGRSVVNAGTFQPDLVWIKARSSAYFNVLFDAVRGVNKQLSSNSTDAETTSGAFGYLSSFNSDGFSVSGGATDDLNVNDPANSYIAWQWKANGAPVANTAGSITSQVSAGVTQGFSVVTYTGTGANATVGHGLGVAPKMVIGKSTTGVSSWLVWHAALPGTDYLVLNGTNAKATVASVWNSAVPTSSVVSLGSDVTLNTAGAGNILYCFSEVAGFSKFGSYVGNGSADGPFVFCGFRPRFVMIKRSDAVGNWELLDSARSPQNAAVAALYPNLSNAEDNSPTDDFLSNGFKVRTSTDSNQNTSGGTYIFAAFAENPFKYSLAR